MGVPSSIDRDRAITELALSQNRFVTSAQLIELGVSSRGRVGLQKRGVLRRVVAGVYELAGCELDWVRRAHALCVALGPDTLVSHDSAARLWALDIPTRDTIEVTIPHGRQVGRRQDGWVAHRVRNLPPSVKRVHKGVPVTSAEWTLIEIAGRHPPDRIAKALDDAVVRRLVRPREMARLLDLHSVQVKPGVRALRVAIGIWLGKNLPTSVPEATLLRAFASAGIPTPRCQYKIFDGDRFVAKVDFAWTKERVALEMDGWQFHSTPNSHSHDYLRAGQLMALGWILVRTSPTAFAQAPDTFFAALRKHLRVA